MDTIDGPMFYSIMAVLVALAGFVIVGATVEQVQEWRARRRAKRDLDRLDRCLTSQPGDYERRMAATPRRFYFVPRPVTDMSVEAAFGLWQPPAEPTYPGDAPTPLWEREFDEIVRARMWGE